MCTILRGHHCLLQQAELLRLSSWGNVASPSPSSVRSRCCNSCEDVREAYRRRGWAFKNPDTIEQCRREGFSQKMQEQKNEGCQVYGFLEVNKVLGREEAESWAGGPHGGRGE